MTLLKPRFALRSLFILVTIVGAFCAYPVSWIRRRHELLTSYTQAVDPNHLGPSRNVARKVSKSTFNLLWLFGEPTNRRLDIVRIVDVAQPNTWDKMVKWHYRVADEEVAAAEKYKLVNAAAVRSQSKTCGGIT